MGRDFIYVNHQKAAFFAHKNFFEKFSKKKRKNGISGV